MCDQRNTTNEHGSCHPNLFLGWLRNKIGTLLKSKEMVLFFLLEKMLLFPIEQTAQSCFIKPQALLQ